MRIEHVLSACMAAALMAGCGAHPATPAVAKADVNAAVRAAADAKLDKPVVATTVLTYGHAVARTLDAKAAFISLVGSQVGPDGTPGTGGGWELQYVGSTVSPPAGVKPNPYNPYTRHITITVSPDGKTRVKQSAQAGLPLGVCYMDAPMPTLDSDRAVDLFFQLRGENARRPLYQVTLAGMPGPHHFDRLVWRLNTNADGTDSTVLDATTGEVIQAAGAAKP